MLTIDELRTKARSVSEMCATSSFATKVQRALNEASDDPDDEVRNAAQVYCHQNPLELEVDAIDDYCGWGGITFLPEIAYQFFLPRFIELSLDESNSELAFNVFLHFAPPSPQDEAGWARYISETVEPMPIEICSLFREFVEAMVTNVDSFSESYEDEIVLAQYCWLRYWNRADACHPCSRTLKE